MEMSDFLYQLLITLGTVGGSFATLYTLWYNFIGKRKEREHKDLLERQEKEHTELQEAINALRAAVESLNQTMIKTVADYSHLKDDVVVLQRRVSTHGEEIDKNHDDIVEIKSRIQYCQKA